MPLTKNPHSNCPEPELLLDTQRFRVVRQHRTLANGRVLPRETIMHPGAVVVVPLLADGRVCLVENYRVAVDAALLELPAGTLEPGEPPADTARRELAEETGYRAERLEPLAEFWMSPGILNERMHVFVATGLAAGTSSLEEGEEIQARLVSWSDALAMIDDGRIQDAKTVAAILLLDRRMAQQKTPGQTPRV